MPGDKLLPGRLPLAFRRGFDAVAFDNIADGISRVIIAEIREISQDAVVAPCPVFFGDADDQSFNFCITPLWCMLVS